jgi:hypothetical protein
MKTHHKINKIAGRAGANLVCAELFKLGIANLLVPEDFPDDDILLSGPQATSGYIQVKTCHTDESFILRETEARWGKKASNEFCVFVSVGATWSNEPPRYWIALKREVGDLCVAHSANETSWVGRFRAADLPMNWEYRWSLFDLYQSASGTLGDDRSIGTERFPRHASFILENDSAKQ